MIKVVSKIFTKIRREEDGVTLVEYGIAIALAIALGISALSTLGSDISDSLSTAGAQMP